MSPQMAALHAAAFGHAALGTSPRRRQASQHGELGSNRVDCWRNIGAVRRPNTRCIRARTAYAGSVGALTYKWRADDNEHELRLVRVPGTEGTPYLFGAGESRRPIELREFLIATTQVTQALWTHVMGSNPAVGGRGPRRPVENVSWDDITEPGGFLERRFNHLQVTHG